MKIAPSALVRREPPDPAPLPGRLHGVSPVVPAGPGHDVVDRAAGEDAHAGDDGPGAAGAASAGDLDSAPGPRLLVGPDDGSGGTVRVARRAEVGPVDPLGGPL